MAQNEDSPLPRCHQDENSPNLDCSDVKDVDSLGCYFSTVADQYTSVSVQFPTDVIPVQVSDFGQGETARFFQEFNGAQASFNRMRKSLTFYGTKFDLSSLALHTNDTITEEVHIKADTVYMGQPLNITYKVFIKARVVSIDKPLIMTLKSEDFEQTQMRVKYEEQVSFNRNILHMRHRTFGLVDIIDVAPTSIGMDTSKSHCRPLQKDSNDVDVTSWFDSTSVNLMYVAARTMLPQETYLPLALDIANFTLDLHSSKEVIGNQRTYVAAQKFKKLQELGQLKQAHNVPWYSLDKISQLSEIMFNRFNLYWINATNMENRIADARARIQDMDVQFQIVEVQQQQYFDSEMAILEEIFAATDNLWHWTFEHRKASDDAIQGAFDASGDLMTKMQEQELNVMLKEAEASVSHYQDVVNKYKEQVDRYLQKVMASIDVQKELKNKLDSNLATLDDEVDNFERAVHEWMAKQIIKAAFNFFKACVGMYFGVPPEDFMEQLEDIEEILSMLNEIFDMLNTIEYALDINFDFNSIDDLDAITSNPSTDFTQALQNAVEMKLSTVKFDEMRNTAEHYLTRVDAETDYEIDGAGDLIVAYVNVADVGKALVAEVVDYSDVVLELMERKDELAVAMQDLERATAQVEEIKHALEELEKAKNDFKEDMDAIKEEYEKSVKEMQEQYANMTQALREEFKKKIMERFEGYQLLFANMRSNYRTSLERLVTSVEDKSYGLKIASMNQRSMILVLYQDYCDTLYYHGFLECNADTVPAMSDNFDILLEKLNSIQWDIITSNENLPVPPQVFTNKRVTIQDDRPLTLPIQSFKNNRLLVHCQYFSNVGI